MDVKKVLKALSENEVKEIISNAGLEFDEIPIATMLFIDKKPRLFICDEYGLSLGKYHYMLNRIIPKIQSYLKLKLLGE